VKVKGRHDAALWILSAVIAALLAANLAVFSSGAALPFVDNFDDRRSGWDVYRTGMGGYNYRDGEFAFWISRGGPLLWLAWSPLSEPRLETLVVEATAYALSGGDGASYGVIFGLDMANYYAFEVRADGYYRVLCHQAGESLREPATWTRAGSAASGSAADRLRVVITGDRAALEVNGLELGAISLAVLKGPYRVGICGGCEGSGPAEVRFTQFAVSIPSQAESAAADAAPPVYPVERVVLQSGNALPLVYLVPKPSWELEDNRIGAHWHLLWAGAPDGLEPHEIEEFPSFAASLGIKRFRLSINSMDSSSVHWDKQELQIDPLHDRFIDTLVSKDIAVTMVLSFWDTAHRAAGWPPIPRFTNETDIQRYLEYVRFMAGHFKGRVRCYELWNEPTIEGTIQWVRLPDYISLVRRAVPVIREVDPTARIVVGGTDYLRYEHSWQFMLGLVSSDIMPLVDVVNVHPLYGTSPEFPDDRDYYYDYARRVQTLVSQARAHGFHGEFAADELVWRTPATAFPGWPNPILATERRAAKHYARGIITNLGLGIAVSQLGVEEWGERGDSFEVVRNLATIMAGHEPIDLPIDIDIDYRPTAYCSFRYPNGDRLLAVWTDGVAQDEDPGVPATITFPGLIAGSVTGIDALYGFEQQLVCEIEGDSTVVRDVRVRDYPILIELSNPTVSATYRETAGDGFHRVGEPSSGSGSGNQPGPDVTPPRGGRDD